MRAGDTAALKDRLRAAEASSNLTVAGMTPWHSKLTVQLLDPKGKPADEGTIEEWWNSPDNDRREYKTANYTATEIRTGGHLYRTQGTPTPPYYLDLLRRQLADPMPSVADAKDEGPRLKKRTVSKTTLECIGLPKQDTWSCFDPVKDALRAGFEEGGLIQVLRNSMGRFVGKEVSLDVAIAAGGVPAATSHVVILKSETSPNEMFAPSTDMAEHTTVQQILSVSGSHQVTSTVVHGQGQVYAKDKHGESIGGSLMLQETIDADGHAHDLRLVFASSPELGAAALAAAQKWTFEPATVDGKPVESDNFTTIGVALDD